WGSKVVRISRTVISWIGRASMAMRSRDKEGMMSRRKQWESSPLFVTPMQFAKLTNISEASVYRLLASGRLEGVRLGRAWRLSLKQLGVSVSLDDALNPRKEEE